MPAIAPIVGAVWKVGLEFVYAWSVPASQVTVPPLADRAPDFRPVEEDQWIWGLSWPEADLLRAYCPRHHDKPLWIDRGLLLGEVEAISPGSRHAQRFYVPLSLPGLGGALVGAMLWGIGVAVVFPAAMSAGGEAARPADAIAAVATVGYGGFLVGPPLIGLLAKHIGLGHALLVLVVMAVGIVVLAPAVQSSGRAPNPPDLVRRRRSGGEPRPAP